MATTTPLTDAITALTTYANTVTGGSDTTLSEAVATLASGYGSGGSTDDAIEAFITRSDSTITSFSSDRAYGRQGYATYVMRDNAFYNSAITTVSLPNATYISPSCFYGGAITNAIFPSLTHIGKNAFAQCISLQKFIAPSFSSALGATMCNGCWILECADLGSATSIPANCFNACYALATVIIRKTDDICTLANVSGFASTPIRGYNSLTGTIYVPSALISTYQTATNWSTVYGEGYVTFSALEGSAYESTTWYE